MTIFCRHRHPIAVARRGKNELSAGFVMYAMCPQCGKDLGSKNVERLPVLISADEFHSTLLGRPRGSYSDPLPTGWPVS